MWTKFYLPSLAIRKKWKREQENLAVGDVVLIIDANLPRGQWKIGHIERIFPGKDGLVRVVEVKTAAGLYTRAIHRLCLLERAAKGVATEEVVRGIDPSVNLRAASIHQLKVRYIRLQNDSSSASG